MNSHWSQYWGIWGVSSLLISAVFRIWPDTSPILASDIAPQIMMLICILSLLMFYFESYKGFYQNFAPRIVGRAVYLNFHSVLIHRLMAPLFCLGVFYSTRKRKYLLLNFSVAIFLLVQVVSAMPSPWRECVDISVAAALSVGILSIFWVSKNADKLVDSGVSLDFPINIPERTQ